MDETVILKGQVLSFTSSPFTGSPTDAARLDEAVAIQNGQIMAIGQFDRLLERTPDARVIAYPGKLITAGFVDAHVHFPQTAMIASWGKRLIDWLNTYTFPEEMRFADAPIRHRNRGALSRPDSRSWHHNHV